MQQDCTLTDVAGSAKYPLGEPELSDDSPGNRPVSKAGGTVGDVDLELVAVIQAWAELPESVKTAACEDGQGLMWFVTECLGLAPAFDSLLTNSPVPSVMDFFE